MNDKSTALTQTSDLDPAIIESVLIGGDLSRLNPKQRVAYYQAVCKSIGLNPLTKPFDYISLNGKLVLYAKRDAADQLRRLNVISIEKPEVRFEDDWIIVTVMARDANGRVDSDVGVVNKKDMQNNFGNALMKAVTKSKRRVTLSICGLGWLDETEIEDIPDAKPVVDAETVPASPLDDLEDEPRARLASVFLHCQLNPAQQLVLVTEYLTGKSGKDLIAAVEQLIGKLRDDAKAGRLKLRPVDDNGKVAKAPTDPPNKAVGKTGESRVVPSAGDSGQPAASEFFNRSQDLGF